MSTKKIPSNAPMIPDEVIDPTTFAREVTAHIGASARFAGRRSMRANTRGFRDVAVAHSKKVEEWPRIGLEIFAVLYDCLLYTSPSPRDRS